MPGCILEMMSFEFKHGMIVIIRDVMVCAEFRGDVYTHSCFNECIHQYLFNSVPSLFLLIPSCLCELLWGCTDENIYSSKRFDESFRIAVGDLVH